VLTRDVAPGIHLLSHADTNLYLVQHGDRVLIVDSGLPRVWAHLLAALRELGIDIDAIDGVLLTHAHFDHVGTARRAQKEWGVPVWVHTDDASLAQHPYRYQHERSRLLYPLRYPASIPALGRMTLAGALTVKGVTNPTALTTDQVLPANPVVIPTPGHTFGHIALHFPDRDAVIAGDALVTLDPYTGKTGPQIVAGAATADSGRALGSLQRLTDTRASVVLPGHGRPWTQGIEAATELAIARGPH
jgi:glyoxylase-like metal-dependent hydrolase (beta-lactamase superfamily II)